MPKSDVVIIGAGAAGLAAAAAFGAAGAGALVLEARGRVGGRVHTLHQPDFPLPIELGAEFMHGRPDETVALIERAGLAHYDAADRHLRRTATGLDDASGYWSEVRRVFDRLDPNAPDMSFADFLARHVTEPELADACTAASRYVEGFHAADLTQVSARAIAEAEGGSASGGSEASRMVNGYAGIVGELHREAVAGGADVQLGHEVTSIQWRPGAVTLTTRETDGTAREWTAPRAVLTAPLPLLQDAASGRGALRLDPFPQTWREALGGLRMGHVVRTAIRFRKRFWERDASFIHDAESPRWQVWWTPAPIDAPLLTGWCGGPPAERLAQLAGPDLLEVALGDLARLFDRPAAEIEELIVGADMHDWSGDPFTRGAYTYVAAGGGESAERLPVPAEGTIAVAGEAAAPSGRHGTVDGAIASGRRAAALLLGTA